MGAPSIYDMPQKINSGGGSMSMSPGNMGSMNGGMNGGMNSNAGSPGTNVVLNSPPGGKMEAAMMNAAMSAPKGPQRQSDLSSKVANEASMSSDRSSGFNSVNSNSNNNNNNMMMNSQYPPPMSNQREFYPTAQQQQNQGSSGPGSSSTGASNPSASGGGSGSWTSSSSSSSSSAPNSNSGPSSSSAPNSNSGPSSSSKIGSSGSSMGNSGGFGSLTTGGSNSKPVPQEAPKSPMPMKSNFNFPKIEPVNGFAAMGQTLANPGVPGGIDAEHMALLNRPKDSFGTKVPSINNGVAETNFQSNAFQFPGSNKAGPGPLGPMGSGSTPGPMPPGVGFGMMPPPPPPPPGFGVPQEAPKYGQMSPNAMGAFGAAPPQMNGMMGANMNGMPMNIPMNMPPMGMTLPPGGGFTVPPKPVPREAPKKAGGLVSAFNSGLNAL